MLANTSPMVSKTGDIRRCLYFNLCGIEEVYNGKKWKVMWYKENGKPICNRCYCRLRPKEYRKLYNDRRITFLGKVYCLTWNIRTGYCSFCSNNVFDGSCPKTEMHHYFYVPIMVWCCTEERCHSCHNIETNKYILKKGLTKGYKKRLLSPHLV